MRRAVARSEAMRPQVIKPPTLTERVQRALRREGEAGTGLLARATGKSAGTVKAVLDKGVAAGWCRLVRKDGAHGVYALTRADGSR